CVTDHYGSGFDYW
nr:immunoglobulin heavy chain junction region [Macaca mulatta]MOW19824.1 immunoglobulin heavy chain junction region [Macaca mulatta]MOW19880.1 immunoglobulin heavy chain junction region [Macaca mulatta]MOW20044.1 immunoglobulin heavy chain junction region [Macaca mulatta]MOW20120.1 immunoglobulin heavy chain junction region [Macaca mulatta]